jgi:hypothetical protein
MKTKPLALLAAAVALLGLGLFAGSVVGDDGSVDVAERIGGDFGEPIDQTATPARSPRAVAAAKAKKPKVLHGSGQPIMLGSGENSSVSLQCPKKYPVPISAGLDTSIPGIFPGIIRRSSLNRAMLVAAINTTRTTGQWTPTIVCMKGAKEA